MVKLECVNCGVSEEVNVLPGKHAVMGAASNLNRKSNCCQKPKYVDPSRLGEEGINRNLGGFIAAFRA